MNVGKLILDYITDEKVEKQVIEKLNANINIPIINEKTEEKILKAVWSTISEVLESVLTKGK
jgi:chorismate mutase|tara:strand:- start:179 stop:364 length:186 start_codon:yes stop_codon:yes gene_type:complete